MMEKIVAGGTTRAEQEAWASARRAGVATGGYMARGWMTEDGPRPRLGMLYGAIEFPLAEPTRLRANLRRSGALLWLGDPTSASGAAALEAARDLGRPYLAAEPGLTPPSEVAAWLSVFEIRTLTIGAEAESARPGLAARTRPFLDRVLAALQERDGT